jgi:hypothetical protein
MTGGLARVVSDITSSRAKLEEILSFAELP